MAKPTRQVSLQIETAQAALAVLQSALAGQMHADDRKGLDSLIERARAALDTASSHLTDIRRDAEAAIDQL